MFVLIHYDEIVGNKNNSIYNYFYWFDAVFLDNDGLVGVNFSDSTLDYFELNIAKESEWLEKCD